MVRGSEQTLIAGISRQDRKSAVGFFSQSADEYPRGSRSGDAVRRRTQPDDGQLRSLGGMIVMLGLALTTIYRNLRQLTGLALHASYLSDAVGSHSEIFWRLGHQIGRFFRSSPTSGLSKRAERYGAKRTMAQFRRSE